MELSVLVYVLLILAFAKSMGEVASRVNQPPIVGELLAGIALGPFLLGELVPQLEDMYSSQFISDLADLGMLFLMLYVGFEFSMKQFVSSSWSGAVIALFGAALPIGLVLLVGPLLGLGGTVLLFVALAVSVTALPVTLRVLKEMEVLGTGTSDTIVSASLICDVALLFGLGMVVAGDGTVSEVQEVALLAVGFVLFFVFAYLVSRYVVPRTYALLKRMRTGEAAFAVAILFAIAFAVIAQQVGLPSFIGAFIAGVLLRETGRGLKVWARVEDILSGMTLGFLAPIFFVLIGFSVEFDVLGGVLPLLAVIVAISITGPMAGAYMAARVCRRGHNEAMAISSMMMAKGAIELIFARVALEQGLFDEKPELFSVLVVMAFLSTILSPMLFRHFYNRAIVSGEVVRP
jgi:Kef-type K+ transport system membrane component KefB